MNKTVAIGYNLVAKDRQLITVWLSTAFGKEPRIVDLMNETYTQEQERALIVFGSTAHKRLTKYDTALPRTIIGAEIDQLDPELGDQKTREQAWFMVSNLAKHLDDEQQKEYGSELTSSLPQERAKRELTPDELSKVKVAMELLDIREFELVPSNQTSSDRSRRSST
jgi:hypothetical protein